MPRGNSTRSRELLLAAATELFADRGFDRTTTREIGERAGVDPALIARYFGSKTGLYVAAVRAEVGDVAVADLLDPARMAELLSRAGRRGPGPIYSSLVQPHADRLVQAAAANAVRDRLVVPLRARYERAGSDRPALRAELTVAAFVGVVLSRSAGALQHLSAAPDEEVLALLTELLAAPA